MTDIQFDEDKYASTNTRDAATGFSPVALVERLGLARDARTANLILLAVAIGAIVVAGMLFSSLNADSSSLSPTAKAQLEKTQAAMRTQKLLH